MRCPNCQAKLVCSPSGYTCPNFDSRIYDRKLVEAEDEREFVEWRSRLPVARGVGSCITEGRGRKIYKVNDDPAQPWECVDSKRCDQETAVPEWQKIARVEVNMTCRCRLFRPTEITDSQRKRLGFTVDETKPVKRKHRAKSATA